MNNFKAGDIIICVNNSNNMDLLEGTEYEVETATKKNVYLKTKHDGYPMDIFVKKGE